MINKQDESNVDSKMSSKEVMWLVLLVGFLGLTLGVITNTMAG